MARRPARAQRDEVEEEVFTDLRGNPDTDAPDLIKDMTLDEELTADAQERRKVRAEHDADLEIVDEDDDDELDDEGADGEDDEGDEEVVAPEPVVAATEGEIIFDPKDAQILAGQAQNLDAREATAKSNADRAKADIEQLKADLEAAQEAGESKKVVNLIDKLADAKVAAANAAGDLQGLVRERQGLIQRAQSLLSKARKDAAGNPIMEIVRAEPKVQPARQGSQLFPKFLKQNPWFNDQKNADKVVALRGLDAALNKEGKLDKNSPEYFDELGRRFNRVYPGLYKTLDGKLIATGRRQRNNGRGAAPVPSGGGGGGGGRVNVREIRLDNSDLAQMRKFGMDPQNKEHLRQWLSTKRADAAREQTRG
jgi:hypothetical protein